MILKGFKFGLLLQIALGPVCLFIFQTAISEGFYNAFFGVLGVTLADALYIFAASLGMGKLLKKSEKTKISMHLFGSIVVILFGLNITLGVLGYSILPSINFYSSLNSDSSFFKAFFLTSSNPLTILFWAGIFSTKIIEDNLNKSELLSFASGAVLSTLIFLTLISFGGNIAKIFFNTIIINILNFLVGLALIFFGLKRIKLKKQTA